ncbi:MAG: arginine--tRNA ligase [Deltaproteobacteria bacterium]|nr:arginine--tRNA ligase [Deltaproteobacteria bacterium]
MIKREVEKKLRKTCEALQKKGILSTQVNPEIHVETPREKDFGDYSTNLAFNLSKVLRKPPIAIAQTILEHLEVEDMCKKTEIAGGGFINFYLKDSFIRDCLYTIFTKDIKEFFPDMGKEKKVLVEFVSSNPTGPLHVGHGRCAAFGDVLSTLLKKAGFRVTKEYYINDAGKQIETLGESVYLRLLELKGEHVDFPENFYKGEYVKEIAKEVLKKKLPVPENKNEAIKFLAQYASDRIMEEIKEDLESFGVFFDSYKKETDLFESGMVEEALSILRQSGYVYEKDGAVWFKTSLFENDEDRVLIKSDGEKTYFTSDIAYHREKFLRGYDLLIDIWGSDHHGYIPRVMAATSAMNFDKNKLKIILIQFVTLLRDGKPVGMSTREARYTTLRELLNEVGKDAARFFFLTRKNDAHLEFDLDLAKRKTSENPVYYVQYAHARIESVIRNAKEEGSDLEWFHKKDVKREILDLLTLDEEMELTKTIFRFFDVIEGAVNQMEPHRITYYLIELAGKFHSYYNTTRILQDNEDLKRARMILAYVVKEVIKEGLSILGVEAPSRM